MAEIPAAMPLTSRTGRRTALFTVPETFSICLKVASNGVIDLLQKGMGAVARVVEKVAHALDLFAPGTDDGDGLVKVHQGLPR
jgi:hypothetical protein